MRPTRLNTLLILLLASTPALAGQGIITGEEEGRWTNGYHNLVVGVLKDIRHVKGEEYGRYHATFVPLATLAGTFDPSLHPRLPVTFYATGLATSIKRVPPEGATVIAVIQYLPPDADGQRKSPEGFIFSDEVEFMPGRSALVPVKDLADPRVAQTLKKLQDARAYANTDHFATQKGDGSH